jgi:coenzyme F420 hydrogenase subunit beta
VPYVATDRAGVLAAAGSRYTYGQVLAVLQEPEVAQARAVAMVGLPCHVRAARKMQGRMPGLQLLIGLFCSETFTYEGLIEEKLQGEMGIDPRQITRMDIKGKLLVETKAGTRHEIALKDLRPYRRPGCEACRDFSAEEGDISVGGLGVKGWTVVLVRTPQGAEVLRSVQEAGLIEVKPIEEFPKVLPLLEKMSRDKKARGRHC